MMISQPLPGSKPHYHLLDGLRGVAALMVIFYHLGEAFATSVCDQWCNHGYLAVQFFFVLSGFVVSYAYDDRWGKTMNTWGFFKRRLIRLHPVVVLGVLLGLAAFIIQGCTTWSGEHVAAVYVAVSAFITMFLVPVAPSSPLDVRGNGELYPLNGPYWSLFCEYIGNIFYAIFLRRLPLKMLALWCGLTGLGVLVYAVGNGSGYNHLGVGWTMADGYMWAGILCMSFCFGIGMLMRRIFKPWRVRGAFWLCSLALVLLLAMPYIGAEGDGLQNGIYDAICVLFVFPMLVWLGASGTTTDVVSAKVCNFLGALSYPLYAVHYPSMYLYFHWVWTNDISVEQALPVCAGLVVGNILLAYVVLRLYDMPMRKWLSEKAGLYKNKISAKQKTETNGVRH